MPFTKKLTGLLLAIWLIATGVIPLLNFSSPGSQTVMAIMAVVVGVLVLLDIRNEPGKNLGPIVFAVWLILNGLIPLLSITFPASTIALAVLALVAGILILLGR